MTSRSIGFAFCAVFAVSAFTPNVSAFPMGLPLGLTIDKGASVYPGYVIFSAAGKTYAITQAGTSAHSWSLPNVALGYSRPLDPGHILTQTDGDGLVELDRASNIVWQYTDAVRKLHHDWSRLDNGNTLIVCSRSIDNAAISSQTLTDDCVIEVDPQGQVVWEWQTADHFSELALDTATTDAIYAAGGDWAHANAGSAIPVNTSHSDPALAPGNIIISYRNLNMIIIVDRNTDAVVWQVRGTTIGQHNPHMLPDSLPGGGNILVFDNGRGGDYTVDYRNYSRVIELNPVTVDTDYQYRASDSQRPDWWFYSWFISSAQRLPDGHTFINEGEDGRMFEITQGGAIVWEFVNPIFTPGSSGTLGNHVYRAAKVPLGWLPAPGGQVPPAQPLPAGPEAGVHLAIDPNLEEPFTPKPPAATKENHGCAIAQPTSTHAGQLVSFGVLSGALAMAFARRRRTPKGRQ